MKEKSPEKYQESSLSFKKTFEECRYFILNRPQMLHDGCVLYEIVPRRSTISTKQENMFKFLSEVLFISRTLPRLPIVMG